MVNETLRIANIIGGVFRRAMTDVTIKGILLEKTQGLSNSSIISSTFCAVCNYTVVS